MLRYYLKDDEYIKKLLELKFQYFIARSLERDKSTETERIQALKLVREIMQVNALLFPNNLVQSLVSIAGTVISSSDSLTSIVENAEDLFSRAAIETLCELSNIFSLFQLHY